MAGRYHVIEVFTSEEARWQGKPVAEAVIALLHDARIAARCIVSRGQAGYYETGEIVNATLEVLSFNMPLKIEIILPEAELDTVLPGVVERVTDGIVVVEDMTVHSHRSAYRPLPRNLLVRDVMAQPPVSVTEDTPVDVVVRRLLAEEFNAMPVVDADGRPVGIITQGDLVRRAQMPLRLGLLDDLGRAGVDDFMSRASAMRAHEVMTGPATTVSADCRLSAAIEQMQRHQLKRLPVVDDDGRLAGMITRLDIFRAAVAHPGNGAQPAGTCYVEWDGIPVVRDVMRRETGTVAPGTSMDEVLRTLSARRVQRIAVVDEDGRLLGLVTDRDILAALGPASGGLLRSALELLRLSGSRARTPTVTLRTTAEEIMKTDLVTIAEDATLDEAMLLMVQHGLKRLPVLDADGRYRGLISRADILRVSFAR